MSPESRAPHQHQGAPRLIFPASKHGELLRPHGCLCDNCDQTCCGRTNLFCKKTDVCSDKTGASVIIATRRVLVAGKRVVSECLTSKLSIVASRRVLFANRRRIIARMCDYSKQTGASARSRRGHCCEQTVDCWRVCRILSPPPTPGDCANVHNINCPLLTLSYPVLHPWLPGGAAQHCEYEY